MKVGPKTGIAVLLTILVLILLSYLVIPLFQKQEYLSQGNQVSAVAEAVMPETPVIKHIETPKAVKGLYMTSCVVGSKTLREGLVNIADTTEINSIVIDVKDFSGLLSFIPTDPTLKDFVSDRCRASDMEDFIQNLHKHSIYAIARITVFQDPFFTKLRPDLAVKRASDGGIWKDKKGISYLDPGSEEAWQHTVAIAKASYAIGFDEINFDYIRFPSDGNMSDIAFPFSKNKPKPEVLESFFSYLNTNLKPLGVKISADLFGMTMTNYDDLGIGQVLERALPYFDFVDPMVYPSHYPATFNGWKDPNKYPYELVNYVMKRGVERAVATTSPIDSLESTRIGTSTPAVYTKTSWDKNKLRPWLQDFNYGGYYGPKEVREQIQATYDVGLSTWLIWNPSNHYTLDALLPEATSTQP